MRTKLQLLWCLAAIVTVIPVRSQIIINELMQSNIDCLMDDFNEFPDSWVELYNSGSANVNLNTYRLGVTSNVSEAWTIPSYTLKPGEYAIIYCDKVNMLMHTPFRLDSGKGSSVYLFKGNQMADSVVNLPKQPAPNIAYGRKNDAADDWGYQAEPTPKRSNCGTVYTDILGTPLFSEQGRVLTEETSLQLELSLPEGSPDGTVIRYTLDGSEPTKQSPLYDQPLAINKTTLVRATAFCDGYMSPRSVTQSFIFHNRELTLPVISLVTDSLWLYSKNKGIIAEGELEITASGDIIYPNYYYTWRRPVNVEFFEGSNEPSVINQLGETRLMGQSSRSYSLKSFVIYANKRFGKKNYKHEFFPDQKPGVKKFKSLILRNSGNDFSDLYMRDAIIQRTMATNADIDWQAWKPAIVYINGNYYGMLNIRERSNDANIASNYGGLEDIDMVEYWNEIKNGSEQHWEDFKDFYSAKGHSISEYEDVVDLQEFNNIMAMNLYFNNYDFPGNNCVWWRPTADGGKWRIIAKDCDFGMGLFGIAADFPIMEWFYNPGYAMQNGLELNAIGSNEWNYTVMFRNMMNNPDYRQQFLDLVAVYMGDFLNERGTHEVWDPMYETIKDEITYHKAAVPKWWERGNYENAMNEARNWIANRTEFFYNHMADFYSAGTPVPMTLNEEVGSEDLAPFRFTINNVPLTRGVFDGKFYAKRTVTVEGVSDGATVKGWRVKTTDAKGNEKTTETPGRSYTFVMPTEGSVAINAVLGDYDGISGHHTKSREVARYSLDGHRLTAPQRGINIVKYADGTVLKVVVE